MSRAIRGLAFAIAIAAGAGVLAPQAAEAGKTGRRNTAIGLGAVAAYGVVKKKPVLAAAAGAGAIYSYVSSTKVKSKPKRRRVVHVHHYHSHGRCGCGHRRYYKHKHHKHH